MRVNEIFQSLQGEGHYTGVAAVFLRLSGCNLQCPFCDTQHQAFRQMSEQEIVDEVSRFKARHIVITGGEPALQLTPSLVEKLHEAGFFVQIETNGTLPLPEGIDWVTCSPKAAFVSGGSIGIERADEVKMLFEGEATDLSAAELLPASEYRLQPLDTGNPERNAQILQATIDFILEHPKWSLSLQTHKMLGVR